MRRGSLASKVLCGIAGGLLTAVGVVLLVLPGPGVVFVAAGLAVLAREYAWAERPLRWASARAREGLALVAARPLVAAADLLGGLALVAVGVVDLTVGLPYLEPLSDAFVVLGGLFLLGSVVYARRVGPVPAGARPDASSGVSSGVVDVRRP
jgi:hypothetical protein